MIPGAPRNKEEAPSEAMILGAALAWAVVVAVGGTWPWIQHWATTVPGPPNGDGSVVMFFADVMIRNVLAGESPFFTQRIFFPEGYNLWQSTIQPVLVLGAVPWLSHLGLYLGLLAFGSLGLATVAGGALARQLGSGWVLSALLGALYAFGPPREDLWRGHIPSAVAAAAIPLVVLGAMRAMARPSWGRVVAVVVGEIALLTTYVYFGLVAALVSVGAWVRQPSWRVVWRTALVAALGLGPLLWVQPPPVPPSGVWNIANADVGDLAVLAPWGLAVFGVRRGWPWLLGAALCVWLALGGCLRWGPTVYWEGWLPWPWLSRHVGLFGMLDIPRYFLAGVPVAALAMVAPLRRIEVVVAVVLVAVVVTAPPLFLDPIGDPLPPSYAALALYPPGTLWEVPGGLTEARGGFLGGHTPSPRLRYQITHRKPIVGGYVSRLPPQRYQQLLAEPVWGDLLVWASPRHSFGSRTVERPPDPTPEALTAMVARLDLRYVLVLDRAYLTDLRRVFAGWVVREEEFPEAILLVLRAHIREWRWIERPPAREPAIISEGGSDDA